MRIGLSQSIGSEDFSEEQWRILYVLSDKQGHPMGELAERVLMNGPAMSKNMDKLVSRGMVFRAVDTQDSRKVLAYITDLGLRSLERLRKRVDSHHGSIEEALGPRKTKQLKKLLETFIEETRRD
jgi:DNA-binding MarR family transcriptional regulator